MTPFFMGRKICLSQPRNLGTYSENIFFAVTQVKARNRGIGSKLIFVDSFSGKSNDYYFKEITVQVFEDLQAIVILKAEYGLMAIFNLADLEAGYAVIQGP